MLKPVTISSIVVAMEAKGGRAQPPPIVQLQERSMTPLISNAQPSNSSEGMQQLIWEDEMSKEKSMDIDPETSQPRNNCTWEPEKWIPQALIAPKYIISSLRIEDQKQYMRDFCMIGKFLGLWPSKKELVKWIQHWWKHKGHHDLQIGSKGFFTIILHNLEDINRIFEGGRTTRQAFFSDSRWRDSSHKRNTSPMLRFRWGYILSHRNLGWRRSLQELKTPSSTTSMPRWKPSNEGTLLMLASVSI
jgi:hypothetical protein